MPILTAYVGSSQVTFLAVKPDREQSIVHFPFVYSEDLYGHFVDEATFYRSIFNLVQRRCKMPAGSFDLVVCWHLKPPNLHINPVVSVSVDKVLAEVPEYSTIFFGGMNSCGFGNKLGLSVETFLSDLSICPQILPTEVQTRNFVDRQLMVDALRTFAGGNRALLFSGERFVSKYQDRCLTYLLAINAATSYGLFDVRVDLDNVLVPLTLVKFVDESLYEQLWSDIAFRSLGTLLKAEGDVECLLETDVGTTQFFEVGNDQLFFVPLGVDTRARVSLKGKFDKVEKVVSGGDLGFVIDTRVGVEDPSLSLGTEGDMNLSVWEKQVREALDRFQG